MQQLTEQQKETIKQVIAESNDYLVRKYIDELTNSISDVWSIDDVLDYCVNHAEIECTEEQAHDVLDYMESRHDANHGYTWDIMTIAVETVLGD